MNDYLNPSSENGAVNQEAHTTGYYDRKWADNPGWIKNKPIYKLLGRFFPRLVMNRKPRRSYYRKVAEIAAQEGDGRFLDLGCGLGNCAGIHSALTGRPSWGIDFSFEAIKLARREAKRYRLPCHFAVGNAYHIGFRDNSFNVVYMGQVLEHLAEDGAALDEALRVLAPGGTLIVSVPREEKIPSPAHMREYSREDVERLLRQSGVSKITFHDFAKSRYFASCEKQGL